LKLLITKILLVLLATISFAQKADTVKAKKSYVPTGVRLGTDLISLAKIPLSDKFDGWEVSGDIDFYRNYLTVEVGQWERTMVSADQNYSNTGNYYRVGADINLLLKDPDKNMFFIGLRYGHSQFEEKFEYAISDDVFGDSRQTQLNTGMKAGWGEVTLGLRVKVWKELWMGYTARLKMAPQVKGDAGFVAYDIPGYGLAAKSTYWGFNYQLYWRFPFRN